MLLGESARFWHIPHAWALRTRLTLGIRDSMRMRGALRGLSHGRRAAAGAGLPRGGHGGRFGRLRAVPRERTRESKTSRTFTIRVPYLRFEILPIHEIFVEFR